MKWIKTPNVDERRHIPYIILPFIMTKDDELYIVSQYEDGGIYSHEFFGSLENIPGRFDFERDLDKMPKLWVTDGSVRYFQNVILQTPAGAYPIVRSTAIVMRDINSEYQVFGMKGVQYVSALVSVYEVGIKGKCKCIPCYRKSDNVVGLYDIINSAFYTNSNAGAQNDFIAGEEI